MTKIQITETKDGASVAFSYDAALVSEFVGGSSTTEQRIIHIAFKLRKHVALNEWMEAVKKRDRDRAAQAEWYAKMDATLPPERWGRSLTEPQRTEKWFSRPFSERLNAIQHARVNQ